MKLRSPARSAARNCVRAVLSLSVEVGAVAWRRMVGQRPLPAAPARILVVRLDLLGDLIFSMPAVQALRASYPTSRIVVLTLPYAAPLAGLYPEIDEVVAVDTNLIRTPRGLLSASTWRAYVGVWRRLRRERFDLAVSVNGRTASLCALLSGATCVVGYEDDSYRGTLDRSLRGGRYGERMHEVEYVRRLAGAVGSGQVPARLDLPVDAAATRAVDRMLESQGVRPEERLLVVHAGSANGTAKRWPERNWSAFIDDFGADACVRVVLVGAASDRPVSERVLTASGGRALDLVGKTTVPELVALLSRAHLVVTGDSGPLHMAVALGRPVVSIYGPTDPAIYGPYDPVAPAVVLRADLPCSPCYSAVAVAECPLGDPICMRLVTVETVVAEARRLLAQ